MHSVGQALKKTATALKKTEAMIVRQRVKTTELIPLDYEHTSLTHPCESCGRRFADREGLREGLAKHRRDWCGEATRDARTTNYSKSGKSNALSTLKVMRHTDSILSRGKGTLSTPRFQVGALNARDSSMSNSNAQVYLQHKSL